MRPLMSVAVMAHPKREPFVSSLVDMLGPDTAVAWDEINSPWDTGRRALLAFDPDASHHLVVQDDATAPPDFVAGCIEALAHVPEGHPVALYMGRRRTEPRFEMVRVVKRTRSFAVFPGPWWGVAVIVPTAHIPDLVDHGDRDPSPNYDHRITHYFQSLGVDCYYTLPSLVDHRLGESLLGRPGRNRRALWCARRATGIDWSRGVVRGADIPGFPPSP